MKRCLTIVAAVAGLFALATLPSCNAPTCGQGTKQVQQKDGTLKCEQVDLPAALTPCDTDMGATIVGGKCVSAVSCGPNTVLQNGQCVGTGGDGTPQCSTPAPGTFCVAGAIRNLTDGMKFSGSIHVSLWDPVTFLGGGMPLGETDVTSPGYKFEGIAAPGLKLIVVVTGDTNRMNATFINTATGAAGVINGNSYVVDAYVIPKAVADSWKTTGGLDVNVGGAYVAIYYSDPKPPVTNLAFVEKTPVMGVQMLKNGGAAIGAKYFSTSLTTIDPALTSTSAIGAGVVASPIGVGEPFPTFSGMGGGITPWETLPGGSAMGVVFVTRFHKDM